MKYFVDFEAQQYTYEIIEIGCVREDGETFHSYVYPGDKHKKISKFIKSLTGISQEQLNNAPDVDTVFTKFFHWLAQDGSKATFYCYGSSDLSFIKASKKLVKTIHAQAALGLLADNLEDYSLQIKKHFGLISTPGLLKVAKYFAKDDSLEQTHAALDDAKLLRNIYLGVQKNEPIESGAFASYKGSPSIKTEYDDIKEGFSFICLDEEEKCVVTAPTLEQAVNEFRTYITKKYPKLGFAADNKSLKKKIIRCLKYKDFYFKHTWKLIKEE